MVRFQSDIREMREQRGEYVSMLERPTLPLFLLGPVEGRKSPNQSKRPTNPSIWISRNSIEVADGFIAADGFARQLATTQPLY
jgi:hypothetical protein